MARKPSQATTDAALAELRAFGLAYPGTHYKSPWPGHLDLAVKDKTFAYLSLDGEPLRISCKLPSSSAMALMLPFVEPAPYGLGKSGWVAARFTLADDIPVEMLKAWLDESYRAQAPRKLTKALASREMAAHLATEAGKARRSARSRAAKHAGSKSGKRTPRSSKARPANSARRTKPGGRA